MTLAKRINLEERLARFEIDDTTRGNLRIFYPVIVTHIDRIVIRFYEYLARFTDAQDILNDYDVDLLREKQRKHWLQLFSGEFDADYVNRSIMIGLSHFQARVPPHIYMASYSFFVSNLLAIPDMHIGGHEFRAVAISINKIIMLDMSIVMNAYMLDSFSSAAPPAGRADNDLI